MNTHIHDGIFLSHVPVCNNMDGSRGCDSKRSQSKCDLTYAWNLKNNAHRTDRTRTQTQSRRGRAAAMVAGGWRGQHRGGVERHRPPATESDQPRHGIHKVRNTGSNLALTLYGTAAAAAKSLSVRLSATPRTAGHQAPPSMGFSRQEYWSGVPLPSPLYGTGGY